VSCPGKTEVLARAAVGGRGPLAGKNCARGGEIGGRMRRGGSRRRGRLGVWCSPALLNVYRLVQRRPRGSPVEAAVPGLSWGAWGGLRLRVYRALQVRAVRRCGGTSAFRRDPGCAAAAARCVYRVSCAVRGPKGGDAPSRARALARFRLELTSRGGGWAPALREHARAGGWPGRRLLRCVAALAAVLAVPRWSAHAARGAAVLVRLPGWSPRGPAGGGRLRGGRASLTLPGLRRLDVPRDKIAAEIRGWQRFGSRWGRWFANLDAERPGRAARRILRPLAVVSGVPRPGSYRTFWGLSPPAHHGDGPGMDSARFAPAQGWTHAPCPCSSADTSG
jgi:hypothetical protein